MAGGSPWWAPATAKPQTFDALLTATREADVMTTSTARSLPAVRLPRRLAFRRLPAGAQRRLAVVLLVAAVLVGLLAGGWGAAAAWRTHSAVPASPGTPVAVPGGALQVDRVVPEGMDHNPGMPEDMMPDPIPEGQRRVHVHVTLHAEDAGGLAYGPERFTLVGDGMRAVTPRADQLGTGHAPEGSTLSGVLVFELPQKATQLALRMDGARQPAALTIEGGDGHDGHSH